MNYGDLMEIVRVSYGDGLSAKKGSHRNSDCLREIYSVLPALSFNKSYLFASSTTGATGITT